MCFIMYIYIIAGSGSAIKVSFPSDGDMLEFLMKNGKIPEKDGLHASWYHSANSKAELNEALKGESLCPHLLLC